MHRLLDAEDQPRYSAQAIAKVLDTMQRPMTSRVLFEPNEKDLFSPTAEDLVTDRRRVKPGLTPAPLDETFVTDRRPVKPTVDLQPEPFCLGCPALAAATSGDGNVWVHEF